VKINPKLLLCLALVLSGSLFTSEAQTNSQSQSPTNIWEYINYPWRSAPQFLASSGEQYGQVSRGLRLDIMNITQGFSFFRTNAITARLYRADGEIVEPTSEGKKLLNAPISVSTASIPGQKPAPQVMTYFPWATNTLEASWIEVSIGQERYWLELPYGFDRNPTDPLPASVPSGPPKFVPDMQLLGGHDHVVRWRNVHYDLGEIQNDWRLSLIQSNSGEAEGQVVLYREDVKIGTSTSWKTNSPTTALRVLDASGTVIGSRCVDVHIQDGGMERSNTYIIAQNGGNLRCWGQIEISVGDKTYQVTVPSSLYKYNHGHTPMSQQIDKIDSNQ
jgi:hypothetical protein